MKDNLEILILLFYYNRPNLVKNALNSIKENTYNNYKIAFIDDGSDIKGEEIINEFYKNDFNNKIIFYNTNDTKEEKIKRGGSIFGMYANTAIEELKSDIIIMLCDDDALTPNYLFDLNNFYQNNQDIKYSYSHIIEFNPLIETYKNKEKKYNILNHCNPINPYHMVDASQVSFRLECYYNNIKFPYPLTKNLDAHIYSLLYLKYGNCIYNNITGQYKAIHENQLGKTDSYDIIN